MDDTTRTHALEVALAAAIEAGDEELMPRLRVGAPPPGLGLKGVRDLVTDADRAAERRIVARVRAAFPEHRIVAEEEVHDRAGADDLRWYIDPLDGTTNFVAGLPLFCVSIALFGPLGGEVGVVYAPYLGECYYAARGLGAFVRGGRLGEVARPLAVTPTDRLIEANLVSGFHYDPALFPNVDLWGRFMPLARSLRRLGSAALDLAFVAAGRFDAMWESGLQTYDIAAGAVLVREAGGRVTDYALGDSWLEGRSLLATNGPLHAALHAEIESERGPWSAT